MDSPSSERINAEFWRAGQVVAAYDHRRLHPAEAIIMLRYREPLARSVLEVGCGAGRILGYLLELGGEVHGIDLSPTMVAHCQRVYPAAIVRVGDLGDLSASVQGRFDVVFAADNVLDVFDDAERRRVLLDLHALITPGGLLVFSSHNLAHTFAHNRGAGRTGELVGRAIRVLDRAPAEVMRAVPRILRRRRNRRRLAPLETRAAGHAILNDSAHDYSLLHYYIRIQDQAGQLAAAGYDLIDTLELDGTPVPDGADGRGPSVYYVARRRA